MDTEHSPDEQWVDHRAAADAWGITLDSARLKLKRYGWPTRKDNIGKRWYRVPEHYQFRPRASDDQPPEPSPEASPEQPPDQAKEISRLTEALASMAEQLARATARADAAQAALEDERRKGWWQRVREAWGGR